MTIDHLHIGKGQVDDGKCKLGLDDFALKNVGDESYNHQPLQNIKWHLVPIWVVLHAAALYGLYLVPQAMGYTLLWALLLNHCACSSITMGTHRLWSHRSYKASWPVKVCLAIGTALAFQNSVLEWARDHRTHHKYSETDADPHNSKRGFFFCHMGWLMTKKHPEVIKKGKAIDISDLTSDPIVAFQHRHWWLMGFLFTFLVPTLVPLMWGESLWNSYFISFILRYIVSLHITWCVNSLAHMYGYKPYDTRIAPHENWLVSFLAVGEGWHNYHHTFPHDYACSEFPYTINTSTMVIDFLSLFGLTSHRRKLTDQVVQQRIKRTGPEGSMERKEEQKVE